MLTLHQPHRSTEYFGLRFDPATGVVTKGPGRGRVMDCYRDDGSITGMVDCRPRYDASPDGLMPASDPRPFALASMLGEGSMKPATNAEMARIRGAFREPDLTVARPAADPLADRRAAIEARVNARVESFLTGPALRAVLTANGFGPDATPVMPTAADLARTLAAGMGMPTVNAVSPPYPEAEQKLLGAGKHHSFAAGPKGRAAVRRNRDAAKQQARTDGAA